MGNLNRHKRIHADVVKRYSCDKCGKSFRERRGLAHHQHVHICTYLPPPPSHQEVTDVIDVKNTKVVPFYNQFF